MNSVPKPSTQIESKLGIFLPKQYKELIDNPPQISSDNFYCPERVIESNSAYSWNLEDPLLFKEDNIFKKITRRLLEGTPSEILERKKEWVSLWVDTKRFVIGSDGGEEEYYIYLDDERCKVFGHDIEMNKHVIKYSSLEKFVKEFEAIENENGS